jgi:hypothetical protein
MQIEAKLVQKIQSKKTEAIVVGEVSGSFGSCVFSLCR